MYRNEESIYGARVAQSRSMLFLIPACSCVVFVAALFGWLRVQQATRNRELILALYHRDYSLAEALLKAGADPNARDLPFGTGLQWWRCTFMETGCVRTVEDWTWPEHPSALTIAIAFELPEDAAYRHVVRVLLDKGASVKELGSWPDASVRWPLVFGPVAWGDSETVRAMFSHGADPNSVDSEGVALLHEAIGSGDVDTVRAVLDAGADTKRIRKGELSNGYAQRKHYTAVVSLLKRRGL